MNNEKRKHILFLSYHLPLDDEPGAFRPWMEAKLMYKAGFSVTVVTSGVQYMTGEDIRPYRSWCTEEEHAGIKILRTWAPKNHRRSLLRRMLNYISYTVLAGIASLLKVHKVGRVFAGSDPVFMMPMVYLISIIKGAALIIDERDLFPETAIALGVIKEGLIARSIFDIQQFFRRHSCSILAATPGIRKKLITYGHSEQKVYLLYNADSFLDDDLKNIRTEKPLYNLIGKNFLVGYARGLGKANDIPVLLRAAQRLKDIEEIGIVVLGNGERLKEYKEYCRDKNIANVHFFDAVPRNEARRLMQQFDICIQPLPNDAHFISTLTSKIFDYHGLGRATVFCGFGDAEDLLLKSKGGVVVPPENDKQLAEVLIDLYGDIERRENLGRNARAWYEKNISVGVSAEIMRKVINTDLKLRKEQCF